MRGEKHDNTTVYFVRRERPDKGHELVPGELDTLMSSDFDEDKTTKIIIHGWLGDSESVKSVCSILKTGQYARANNPTDWWVIGKKKLLLSSIRRTNDSVGVNRSHTGKDLASLPTLN